LRLPSSLFCLPALCLFCAASLPAQSPAETQSPATVLKTNARAVVVDVVVTKGNDKPVTGLTKESFQISEDGKPQTIDFFEEHTAKELPPDKLQPLPPMPPGVYTNVPAVPPTDAVNVILLDTLNSEGQDFSYGRAQVLEFLRNLKPGTRAAIFLLSDKLSFVQGFTADNALLAQAINDTRNKVAPSKSEQFHSRSDAADDAEDLARLAAMMNGYVSGGGVPQLDSIRKAQSESAGFQYARRVGMTLESLSYLARYLGNIPGRKNLLWFAGNFPVNVFPSAQQAEVLSYSRIYGSEIRKTADLLTAGKVAVYPINIQGMMEDHSMEADAAGPGRAPSMQAHSTEANDRADTIFAMTELAADTGGHAFYNTNDLAAAAGRALEDGSHFYTLVYTPTNTKMDGNFRSIKVKLSSGHYTLSYRRGYNADDPAKLASASSTGFLSLASTGEKPVAAAANDDPLRPLFIHGLPPSTQILYAVRVLPMNPQPANLTPHAGKNPKIASPATRYSIDFFIHWKDVQFDPESPRSAQTSAQHASLQISLLARDRQGQSVNWTGGTQQMHLRPETFAAIRNSGIQAHAEIDLPNTDLYLMTGIYDWATGKAGTLEIPLHPPTTTTANAAPPE
jgi:VWFA-related protein